MKNQFDKSVKMVRTDNWTKFVNSVCTDVFNNQGLIHQKTCPYTPQQNGVAERKHRYILQITRAIRFQAGIPIRFWGHCIQVVVDLINRLPSTVIENKTPYEKLYGIEQFVHHLKVIGYICYAKIIQQHDKLMPRSKPSIHMGYAHNQKGYLLYDMTDKIFFVNRNVIFKEDCFPFKCQQSKSQPIFTPQSNNQSLYNLYLTEDISSL